MMHTPLAVIIRRFCCGMVLLVSVGQAAAQGNLDRCQDIAFSTEEEFVTQGPVPPDGNINDEALSNRLKLTWSTHASPPVS